MTKERKQEIIRLIDEQGKLTEELTNAINNSMILAEIEDIYRPYKQKKRTRATIAKEKGLEPLANIIYEQKETRPIEEIAKEFITSTVDNVETDQKNDKKVVPIILLNTNFFPILIKANKKNGILSNSITVPMFQLNK